jgi:hypothetical protein
MKKADTSRRRDFDISELDYAIDRLSAVSRDAHLDDDFYSILEAEVGRLSDEFGDAFDEEAIQQIKRNEGPRITRPPEDQFDREIDELLKQCGLQNLYNEKALRRRSALAQLALREQADMDRRSRRTM